MDSCRGMYQRKMLMYNSLSTRFEILPGFNCVWPLIFSITFLTLGIHSKSGESEAGAWGGRKGKANSFNRPSIATNHICLTKHFCSHHFSMLSLSDNGRSKSHSFLISLGLNFLSGSIGDWNTNCLSWSTFQITNNTWSLNILSVSIFAFLPSERVSKGFLKFLCWNIHAWSMGLKDTFIRQRSL